VDVTISFDFTNTIKIEDEDDVQKKCRKLKNCYRHNLTGPRDGPRASWAEGKHGNSLQISFCANMSRARMAVYLSIV
jgi:hypothetical protein